MLEGLYRLCILSVCSPGGCLTKPQNSIYLAHARCGASKVAAWNAWVCSWSGARPNELRWHLMCETLPLVLLACLRLLLTNLWASTRRCCSCERDPSKSAERFKKCGAFVAVHPSDELCRSVGLCLLFCWVRDMEYTSTSGVLFLNHKMFSLCVCLLLLIFRLNFRQAAAAAESQLGFVKFILVPLS